MRPSSYFQTSFLSDRHPKTQEVNSDFLSCLKPLKAKLRRAVSPLKHFRFHFSTASVNAGSISCYRLKTNAMTCTNQQPLSHGADILCPNWGKPFQKMRASHSSGEGSYEPKTILLTSPLVATVSHTSCFFSVRAPERSPTTISSCSRVSFPLTLPPPSPVFQHVLWMICCSLDWTH